MSDNFEHALEKENRRLNAEVERLTKDVERLRQDRSALLNVKSTDGLTSSEWMMRTAKAEADVERLTHERDDERARADANSASFDRMLTECEEWKARAETAEARSWVQCTTASNECLGGCRSTKEHDAYVNEALIAELESLRPMTALHEDMTRLKREAEARAETAEADNAALLAEMKEAHDNIESISGDVFEMPHPGAALLEERKRIAKTLDAANVPSEADEAEKGRACDLAGRVELLASWGQRGWREYRKAKDSEAALLERLRAAENVVETSRAFAAEPEVLAALAAYDALKEGT